MLATADPGLSRPDASTHAEQRRQRRIPRTSDGRLLKPGQRLPNADELAEVATTARPLRSLGFPSSARWEITPAHARLWLLHGFAARRGDTNHARAAGDLCNDEFYLLLADLDCYADMAARGKRLPPLHVYLQAGREEWGWLGRDWRWLVAQWEAVDAGLACELPLPADEADEDEWDDG